MAIIIKKKTSSPAPAEVVEGGLAPKVNTERTPEEIRQSWDRVPPPNAKRIICQYCRKDYLRPCTETEYKACGNWFHLQQMQLIAQNQKKEAESADNRPMAGGEDDRAGKDLPDS